MHKNGISESGIRKATRDDVPAILRLIHGLAVYEKAADEVLATEDNLMESLFVKNPQVYCHVATQNDVVVGIAIWHLNYSTWLGKHGIYLEDLFVIPGARGQGHGLALLRELAKICVEKGYPRLQWWVLDWNRPAIDFYESLGTEAMSEWTTFRMTGNAISNLATPHLKKPNQ